METLRFPGFVLLVGYLGCQGYAHGRWGGNHKPGHSSNRMCPLEDPETNRCYELAKQNSTCIVATITGCDPRYTGFCKLMIEYEQRPCTVYTCSHQGCCDGYTENGYGSCVSEDGVSLSCKNGGTETAYGTCLCPEHFRGTRCQTPICSGECLNGGRCEVENGKPMCICPSSLYSGTVCETVSCEDSCLNGGKCLQDGVLSRCKCTHGYQGDRCQYPISEKCSVVQTKSRASCGAIYRNKCETDLDCVNNTDKTACCYNGCSGECRAPELKTCAYNGRIYNSGETFSPDMCKRCVCQVYGEVHCSDISSPEKRCGDGTGESGEIDESGETEHLTGDCCKVCPGEDLVDMEAPMFKNCPDRFVVRNVSENGDVAHLSSLFLEAKDAHGSKLDVSFTQTQFSHSRSAEIRKNIHIVTAYSECDPHGRRAECNFKVIVKDPFPPVFKSCPADIYGDEDLLVSWDEPIYSDNVDLYSLKVDGDHIRNRYLPFGTYPVSYTIWDYDMNQAICTFLVRIMEESFSYRHEDIVGMHRSLPIGTIVGIATGLIVASGLCICFSVRVRQLRREQDEEQSRSEQDPVVFSVGPNNEQNPDMYENINMKLPALPEYSPQSNPPSYDQIEHDGTLGDREKVVPPIYDEISAPVSEEEAPQYENMSENGEDNNAYVNEEPNMENMKI